MELLQSCAKPLICAYFYSLKACGNLILISCLHQHFQNQLLATGSTAWNIVAFTKLPLFCRKIQVHFPEKIFHCFAEKIQVHFPENNIPACWFIFHRCFFSLKWSNWVNDIQTEWLNFSIFPWMFVDSVLTWQMSLPSDLTLLRSCQLGFLYLAHQNLDQMVKILQTTFSSAFSWMKIVLCFKFLLQGSICISSALA